MTIWSQDKQVKTNVFFWALHIFYLPQCFLHRVVRDWNPCQFFKFFFCPTEEINPLYLCWWPLRKNSKFWVVTRTEMKGKYSNRAHCRDICQREGLPHVREISSYFQLDLRDRMWREISLIVQKGEKCERRFPGIKVEVPSLFKNPSTSFWVLTELRVTMFRKIQYHLLVKSGIVLQLYIYSDREWKG